MPIGNVTLIYGILIQGTVFITDSAKFVYLKKQKCQIENYWDDEKALSCKWNFFFKYSESFWCEAFIIVCHKLSKTEVDSQRKQHKEHLNLLTYVIYMRI